MTIVWAQINMLKKINKWYIAALGWIVLSVAFIFLLRGNFIIWDADDYNKAGLNYEQVNASTNNISQEIDFSNSVQSIGFLMVNTGVDGQCVLEVVSSETNEVVWNTTVDVPASGGNETVVTVNMPEGIIQSGTYVLNLTSMECDTIYICVEDTDFGKSYSENDVSMIKHLRMNVVYGASYDYILLVIVWSILALIGLVLIYAISKNIAIEKVFVILSLSLGILLAFINPFGQEPDGWVHFLRSVDVSYGNLALPLWDNNGNSNLMRLPENIQQINFIKVEPDGSTAVGFVENAKNLYFSENIIDVNGMGGFSSLFYLPQAIGIVIARVLGLSAFWWMFFGRVMNLICYTALAYFGIKKTPIYKNIFLVVALLPMTVYQAASVSYDSLINGLSILFIGLCFYMAYGEKEKLNWKDTILLGGVLALLFMCKYIYICLGILVFLIPKEKFGTVKEYIKTFAISLIPVFVAVGMILLTSMIPATTSIEVETPSVSVEEVQTVEETSQLEYVLHNPIQYVKILVSTIIKQFDFYMRMLNTFGWMNYSLNILQFLVPIFMVAVAVLDSNGIEKKIKLWDRCIMFLGFLLVLALGMTGLYLFDSNANIVGAQIIAGYQTRYAIPGMIVLLSSITSINVKNSIKNFSYGVCAIMGGFVFYSALTVLMICY